MKIISWNVNGIRAAYRNGFLNFLRKESPDIICLQETKARTEDFPEEITNLNGYHLYHSQAQKKGYAGTAIFSKIKAKKIIDSIGVPEFDNEGRFILADFGSWQIFNTYFPHSQRELARLDFKLRFNRAYLAYIKKLTAKFTVLTGDYNYAHHEIDLANPKQNEKNAGFTPKERRFGDLMSENNWVDTFRYFYPQKVKYTWWTYRFSARQRNIGWRIDYFFVKQKYLHKVKKSQILDQVMGSDHCPILLKVEK